MLKLIKRLKKGVSIVEVVIAIAVISIISVSAVSTLTYAKSAQNKNMRGYDLANTCNTVIDYFWFYQGINQEFWSGVECCGYNIEIDTHTIVRDNYKLTVTIDKDSHRLTLTAFDNNGTQFYQITYEGGA